MNKLRKYAKHENLQIKFINGWIDDYSNSIIILNINGKVFSLTANMTDGQPQWSYFFGIGTLAPTEVMPAGRADYLVGEKIENEYSKIINDIIKRENPNVVRIPNKGGVSWTPKSEQEKHRLVKIVELCEIINKELATNGIVYSDGDKYIYGEDLSSKDVLKWNLPGKKEETDKLRNKTNEPHNSSNVIEFSNILKQEYKKQFGRDLMVGSTNRNALEQAEAMRYPLASGDYDRMYGHLGQKAEDIKKLISKKDYINAAEIIKTTPLAHGSHMAGRAIDIPFNANNLSSSDKNKFDDVITRTSKITGISARTNSERSTHFHIDLA